MLEPEVLAESVASKEEVLARNRQFARLRAAKKKQEEDDAIVERLKKEQEDAALYKEKMDKKVKDLQEKTQQRVSMLQVCIMHCVDITVASSININFR